MNLQREEKFRRVAARRQPDLTVVLENVVDPHNIGAVLRSCDSVGIKEVFVLYTEPELQQIEALPLGRRTSGGARRWLDVHYYVDAAACFSHVRQHYDKVLGTYLHESASSLYELDLTASVALLFGNERLGISPEVAASCDGHFLIPQMGMAESLNISVACAVTLYEAYRQRHLKGMYDANLPLSESEQEALFQEYVRKHEEGIHQRSVLRKRES